MVNQDNQKLQEWEREKQNSYTIKQILLLNRILGMYFNNKNMRKNYCGLLLLLIARNIFDELEQMGHTRLTEHLLTIENQVQSNQSKRSVAIIMDKTCDGPRFGRKQYYAHKQYTGSYGVVNTHGWFFLVAYIGNEDRGEIIFLGASIYMKGSSDSEWKEGLKMLERVGKALDEKGFDRSSVTVVVDNVYMNGESQRALKDNKWIYIGKAGGRYITEIDGETMSLAEHARRHWGGYRKLNECYHDKTKVTQYKRFHHFWDEVIYFHGLFPKQYAHWAYRKRFLVTNNLNATAQWAFGKYNQRWKVEVYFRNLKQVCGWREYHPHGSGNTYQVHTAIVILLYSFLSYVRRSRRGFGKYTIGEVRRILVKEALANPSQTIFPNLDLEFPPWEKITL